MTQTVPHTPSAEQPPEYREELQVMGGQLVTKGTSVALSSNMRVTLCWRFP